MPLNLNDLLKKAESKGITQKQNSPSSPSKFIRPWQQESVLYMPSKLETNLSQSEAKPEPNLSQNRVKLKSNLSQIKTKVEPEVKPNLSQSEAKLEPKIHFTSLIGLQRKIILFIHEICQTIIEQRTHPLSIEFISTQCQSPKSAVRKAIQRLEQKKIIIRTDFKNGRGGWTRYQLSDHIYQEVQRIKNHKLEPNLSQSEAKVETELRTEVRPNASSSSSVINNKNTTTSELSESDGEYFLSEEWQVINIEPLADIGFSKHHLKQIANQNKISTVLVQESINAFAFDLKQNGKGKFLKTNPINYLMGILRNGIPYSPPPNYESEESRSMRIYLERKREVQQKQVELEEELLKAEFNDWQNTLTNEQIDKILPNDIKNSNLAPAKTAALRTYFRNEIWPIKRQEIVNMKCIE